MIGWYFNRFVEQVDSYEMPARFLRVVAKKYTFGETSGISYTNTWLNTMDINESQLASLKSGFRPGGTLGESTMILTLYHESTHAYLDLKENEQKFKEFIRDGTAYYRLAPLQGGGTADDPDRIFQEAAASYVAHRAATWYGAYDEIESYREGTDEKTWEGHGDKAFYDRVETRVRKIPGEYDQAMRDRMFGYQEKRGVQVSTTQGISARIKAFCDDEILEGKIPDYFVKSEFLERRYESLLTLIAQSRTLVPVEVIKK
jgi:hypothetical protein